MSVHAYSAMILDRITQHVYEIAQTWDDNEAKDWRYSLVYYWTEGNWSCDCNRALLCGLATMDNPFPCNTDANRFALVQLWLATGQMLFQDVINESHDDSD